MASKIITDDIKLDRLLNEQFKSDLGTGYANFNGTCLPKRYKDFAHAIENFEIRDDDVWLCGFSKTGKNFQINF